MDILIVENSQQLATLAARRFQRQLSDKPDSVFGLATGRSPLALYELLAEKVRTKEMSFSDSCSFNLDEFYGLEPDDQRSYRSYMQRELFDHVDFPAGKTFLPECALGEDPACAAKNYEDRIRKAGGIDLQLLGLGQNGHIGFNEPSSSLGSRTRIKTLTPQTLAANQGISSQAGALPELAMTMGIATIMDAKEILLLACGSNKARAVRELVEGCICARWPASILQMHARVSVIVDEAAAGLLEMREYYVQVQRQKRVLSESLGREFTSLEAES